MQAAAKARSVIRVLKHKFTTKDPRILTKLFTTYVRPSLEFCTQVWSPGLRKDIRALESPQRWFTKTMDSGGSCYSERLELFGLNSLALRRQRFDLIFTWRTLFGFLEFGDNEDLRGFKYVEPSGANARHTRSSNEKHLRRSPFRRFAREKSFFIRVVPQWNALPTSVRNSESLRSFKAALKHTLKENFHEFGL